MSCIAAVLPSSRHHDDGPVHTVRLALRFRDSIIITTAHNACRHIAALVWFNVRQAATVPPPRSRRSFDHLIASCSHPKVYMPNCALALPAPCVPPFLHRNCGVALGVWMFKVLPFFAVFHSLTIPLRRVAKRRVDLVAKPALDSICQNLSMHVTRTALLPPDRRLRRKTGHSK